MHMLARLKANDGYNRWLNWTEWPLVALGLIFVVILILPLAEPLTQAEIDFLDQANIAIWALFLIDYLARLYLVPMRVQFVKTHILDLIVIAVPFLRPFRLLRLLAIIISTSRRAGGLAVRRVTFYVVGVAVIAMSVGAVVVYDAEKETPADLRTIKTLGDAFWWAFVTVTTVGYGDVYPRSAIGRVFACVLMIVGIALIGTITAAVASWFVNIVRTSATSDTEETAENERLELLAEMQALAATVDALRNEVRALGGSTPRRTRPRIRSRPVVPSRIGLRRP